MGIAVWILFGIIAIIIYLIIYFAKKEGRKQRRTLKQALAETAIQNSLEWTYTDIGRQRAIAWCAPKGILFFMDFAVTHGNRQLIRMAEVETYQIVNHYAMDADKKALVATTNIIRIELQFVFEDKRSVALVIYNEHTDGVFEKISLSEKARNLKALIAK